MSHADESASHLGNEHLGHGGGRRRGWVGLLRLQLCGVDLGAGHAFQLRIHGVQLADACGQCRVRLAQLRFLRAQLRRLCGVRLLQRFAPGRGSLQ